MLPNVSKMILCITPQSSINTVKNKLPFINALLDDTDKVPVEMG
jgi:hypothetical protein